MIDTPLSLDRGAEFAGYRIEEVVGRGGMSVVYRASDNRLKRNVALKLLTVRDGDESARDDFLRESELAASLDHPNIVPIYEAGEFDGVFFIAMRYVEGSDLRQLIRRTRLSPAQIVVLAGQIAGALDAAHARGLVHGDVKPSNVLLAQVPGDAGFGHAYLTDFGLTRRLSERRPEAGGPLMGTIDYIAPEQIAGGEVDRRADLYSLGCLVYECLTGNPPFPRYSDAAVLFAHLEAEAPRPSERRPDLPVELDAVIAKALSKSPELRYQSGSEFVEAIATALGLAASPRSSNSRPAVVVLFVAAALVAVAIGALALATRDGTPAAVSGKLVRIAPDTGRAAESVKAGTSLAAVAVGAGGVWAIDGDAGTVLSFDPATKALRQAEAHGAPTDIAVSDRIATVANGVEGTAAFFDAATGSFSSVLQLPGFGYSPARVASGSGWAWLGSGGRVARIDLLTQSLASTIKLPLLHDDEAHGDLFLTDIAVGAGAVWVSGDVLNPTLWRIDPATSRVTDAIALPFAPDAVAAGLGAVWVANQLDDSVTRIDQRTRRVVVTIEVGREPVGITVGMGSVWVANALDGTVSRIDPATNRVIATIAVGGDVEAVVAAPSGVWVAIRRA